jgi:hypothetical protein
MQEAGGLIPPIDFVTPAPATSRGWQDRAVDVYTHAILSLPGKIIVLLCAIGLLVVGVTQAPQSRTGYSLHLLVSTGESLRYLNRASDVFGGLQQDVSLVFEGFDLRQDADADAAEATYAAVLASQPFNNQPDAHFFVLPAFRAWAASNASAPCDAYQSLPQVNVADCVKGFLAQNSTRFMSNQVVYTDQGDIAAMKADLILLPFSTIDILAKVGLH